MFDMCCPDAYLESTYVIPFEELYERGFRGLIFDIDNTLVPHGAPADERAIKLFARLKEIGFETCLISNNKEPRVKMFNEEIRTHYVFDAHKPSTRNYKKAMELMGKHEKEKAFRSPAKWKVEQYGKKGLSSITMTALSLFALSSAILQYDWVALITYSMAIIIGVSFGLVSMKAAEKYWSEEFYFYATKHYGGEDHV